LSNNLKQPVEGEGFWPKFETDSLESPSLSTKKDNNFVCLQKARVEEAYFIPFDTRENNSEKIKIEEKILDDTQEEEKIPGDSQEKIALLEREAYEKGFSQGEKDGLELGDKKAIKVVESIEKLLVEIDSMKKEIIEQSEGQILELIFAIAKKIVHHQAGSDEKTVRGTIINALLLATEKSKVILRVNPDNIDYIEKLKPEILTRFKELKSMMVTSDPSVTRGGCLLETPYGDVDAGIETQLEKICQCLDEAKGIGN